MEPTCRVPLSTLKYFEVFPLLMTHDSWLFNVTIIHSVNSVPKSIFSSLAIKKWWLTESKAISISTVTKNFLYLKLQLFLEDQILAYLLHLYIYFSHIHFDLEILFWVKHFLRRSAKALEINFTSTLSKKIGRQFWVYLLSRRFFSINFITACFCNVVSCFTKCSKWKRCLYFLPKFYIKLFR